MSMVKSRRKFLKLATAGTCGALIHKAVTPYESMFAYGAVNTNKVLIVINFGGGASYNTAPIYNGVYRDKNPTISFGPEAPSLMNGPTGSHFLTDEQGLHPALTGLKTIWDQGNLALINMAGYPNPNRSHDESTQIWFRGMRSGGLSNGGSAGWAARLTCQLGNAYSGLSLAGSNLLVSGGCNPPRAYNNIAQLGDTYIKDDSSSGLWANLSRANVKIMLDARDAASNPSRNIITNGITAAESSIKVLKNEVAKGLPETNPDGSEISFGGGFGSRCEEAAKMITATSLGVQFIFLEMGGFDTHSDERDRLSGLMGNFNRGITALYQTLSHPAVDRWKDVTIITMSEFCRTFENDSQGTDHGHAAPMFVFGGGVKGGIKSPTPTAAEVAAANGYFHNYAVDFREPFYGAISKMGLDPSLVFPEAFNLKNLDLFL